MLGWKETRQQKYQERKAQHLCVSCQKQDERTLAGKTICFACYEKQKKCESKQTKNILPEPKKKVNRKKKNSINQIIVKAEKLSISYGEYVKRYL